MTRDESCFFPGRDDNLGRIGFVVRSVLLEPTWLSCVPVV